MQTASYHITQVNYSNGIICLVSRNSFTHDRFVLGRYKTQFSWGVALIDHSTRHGVA